MRLHSRYVTGLYGRFFAGLDLVEPGVVQVHRWRPGTGDLNGGRDLAIYAGVGRKP